MKKIPASYAIIACLLALSAWSCKRTTAGAYQLSVEETLEMLQKGDFKVSPEEGRQLLEKQGEGTVFIDLRSESEYVLGKLEGAINIPTPYILDKDNLKLFSNENTTFILYGKDEAQANGPWMLLRQLGYRNVKLLEGGYAWQMDTIPYLAPEKAAYDYAALMAAAAKEDKEAEEATRPIAPVAPVAAKPAPKQITPQKKETPKAAPQEEEGC